MYTVFCDLVGMSIINIGVKYITSCDKGDLPWLLSKIMEKVLQGIPQGCL